MKDISFDSLIETLNLLSTGVSFLDQNGKFVFWNKGAELITGIPEEKIVGNPFDQAFTMRDVFGNPVSFDSFLTLHEDHGTSASMEAWIETPSKLLTRVRVFTARLLDQEKKEQGIAIIFHDAIIEEILGEAFENVFDQAKIDFLTRLYNKETLLDDLSTHLENIKRAKYEIGIIFMDIDGFKKINDRFGHVTGDTVLSLFGKLIKHNMRKGERAYRYGGDEFVVLLMINQPDEVVKFIERLEKSVSETHFPVTLRISTGYSILNGKDSPLSALEKADKNMYETKKVKQMEKKEC